MNNDEKQNCLDKEYVTKTESYSNIKSASQLVPRKSVQLDANVQTRKRCDVAKAKFKHNWRRFVTSWMKRAVPVGKVAVIEAAAISKPSRVQICLNQALTPKQSGYIINGSLENKSSKEPSYERVLSNYNFDEETPEHKTSCDRCKQKGLLVCGKHSTATESSSRNSRPIHIGVASVSSDRTKAMMNQSCSCSQRKKKQEQNCPIRINSNHSNGCQTFKEKRSSTGTSSFCQESLLGQLKSYLIKLTTDHKISCQRCNQNTSSVCKVSLLENAREYLYSLFSDHKTGCQRCNQKETTSYLETIIESAWLYYLKKIGSNDNSSCPQCKHRDRPSTSISDSKCCQSCLHLGIPVCCKHSSAKKKPIPKPVCCKSESSQNQEIIKYASSNSTCGFDKDSFEAYAKRLENRADEVFRDYKTCPKICHEKASQRSIEPAPHCKSTEEPKISSNVPCCKFSSQRAQPGRTESPRGSCYSFQSTVEPRKLASCTKPSQTIDNLQDHPCKKHSSGTKSGRVVLGYHNSTRCVGSCQEEKNQEDDCDRPKQSLCLITEPKVHTVCASPKNCKHSTQSSPSGTVKSSPPPCTGACRSKEQEKAGLAHSPSCAGGCPKCPSQYAAPMYQEQRMVDAEYEAFLDEKFGRMVAQQLIDKETICRNSCECLACIDCFQSPKPESSEPKADPNKYRFYY